MHKCRNCGASLSRLDKEICPFCGCKKPLEGTEDKTEDITKYLDPINESTIDDIKPKSKIIAALLAFLFGFLGIHSFYLGYKNHGIIILISSILVISGIGSILYFGNILHNVFAFLIPYFCIEALMIGVSIAYLVKPEMKDARGEFIR